MRTVSSSQAVDTQSQLIVLASGTGYDGFLVIDSLQNNTSSGGVRIAPDLMLEEVQNLAREMTMKFALFRLPRGGAKAGLRIPADLSVSARRRALEAFGRQIGPIIRAGLYYPGMDMNCGPEDLQTIYMGAGLSIGWPTDSSYFTAVSAANAIEGCAQALGGPRPMTLAIDGFGSVARHLAVMLSPSEFIITAVSTVCGAIVNPEGFLQEDLDRNKREHGDEMIRHLSGAPIPLKDLLSARADILVPSARTWALTEDVARRIRARAVVPIANAPYSPGTIRILFDRGVLCLPGYLCNAGGVFGSSLADNGVSRADIEQMFRLRYRPLIRGLLDACIRRHLSPVIVVDEMAGREADSRATRVTKASFPHKLYARTARYLPRMVKKQSIWRQCQRAFDAMEHDFSLVGT